MNTRNLHFQNANEGRAYPLDDTATALSDDGERLPSGIIADLRIRWTKTAGTYAFISGVAVTAGAVTITFQAADSLDNGEGAFVPIAAVSIPKAELEEGRVYTLKAMYPETFGYIVFGSGVQSEYRGRFSTPAQSRIAPRAGRFHRELPVKSLGKLHNATALTGVVQLLGAAPIEIVKESRTIDSVERDVIVIRLADDPTAASTGQAEESVFNQFSGPCSRRPDSGTCPDPQPIEYINAVAPDCDGVICVDFSGIAVVGRNTDDCGIVVDLPFGLSSACLPPFLPNDAGELPSEVDPINITPPLPPEPPLIPTDSVSESVVVLGSLPYCDSFDDFAADSFVVKNGQWVFVSDDSPEEICGLQTDPLVGQKIVPCLDSVSDSGPCISEYPIPGSETPIASSYAAEGSNSASQRNVSVWDGFDVTTFHRTVQTDLKLMPGPDGARRNGGIVVNYRPHAVVSGLYVYYAVEIDYDTQEFRIRRWNGTTFLTSVAVTIPGLLLQSWYRIAVDVRPSFGTSVYLTARLTGIDDPSVNATLGPLLANNYEPDNGLFGLCTDRALCRFSYFHLAELI